MKYILGFLLLTAFSFKGLTQQIIKVDDALLLDYYQTQRFMEAAEYLKKNFQEPITDAKVLSSLAYT
jgi:hypothetical protein